MPNQPKCNGMGILINDSLTCSQCISCIQSVANITSTPTVTYYCTLHAFPINHPDNQYCDKFTKDEGEEQ